MTPMNDKVDPFTVKREPEHFERVVSVEETKRLLAACNVAISVSEGTRRGDGRAMNKSSEMDGGSP